MPLKKDKTQAGDTAKPENVSKKEVVEEVRPAAPHIDPPVPVVEENPVAEVEAVDKTADLKLDSVAEFRAKQWNIRDPHTQTMIYVDRPCPAKVTAWILSQLHAGVIYRV